MKHFLFFPLAFGPLLAAPMIAHSVERESVVRGKIFYDKLDPKYPSFMYESRRKESGDNSELTTIYRDKDGLPLVVEKTSLERGKLVKHHYQQFQVKESGEVALQNGKAQFTFTANGKVEQDAEDIEPSMILSDMVADTLRDNWPALMSGDSVKVRYLSVERCESIGFKFFKDNERLLNGRAVVDFKMKPSSIFIAALVPAIRITMGKAEPHSLVETEGRLPIRVSTKQPPKERSDYHAIDARVELTEPQLILPAPPEPLPPPAKLAPTKKITKSRQGLRPPQGKRVKPAKP